MIEAPDTIGGAAAPEPEPDAGPSPDPGPACRMCGGPLPDGGFVLAGHDGSLRVSCSEACLRAVRRQERRARWAARWLSARRLTVGVTLLGACVTPHEGKLRKPRLARAAPVAHAPRPAPPPLPAGWFGPEWPPTKTSLLAALGEDSWIHPLAGPFRRMPLRDSRVFGAVRPGNRAIECRNGHCGVDLGGEIWGEHVHAVHDGVVDHVQRGPNQEHGGQYVRIAHRNGTVFTQYFHLAAIPRALERGTLVKSGDVVGLLGDTGVKESQPHLHFSVSVRAWKDGPERYMDPEPLIALWPLRVPIDGGEAALVTTTAQAGVPLGSAPLRRGRGDGKKLAGKKSGGGASAAGGDGEDAAEEDEGEGAMEQAPAPADVPPPASGGAPGEPAGE